MNVRITPVPLSGTIRAIASKSQAHRLLICAALADAPTRLHCTETSADIDATIRCLCALGAQVDRQADGFQVIPIGRLPENAVLDVGESGSTLRFLLPVVGALGVSARFILHGRLAERPLSPLWEELSTHGMALRRIPDGAIETAGTLSGGQFRLPGNISSQFISGLLFALPLLHTDSRIVLTTPLESASYLTLTKDALGEFAVYVSRRAQEYWIDGGQKPKSPGYCVVEGDWSNAAFALCAGALGGTGVTVTGLRLDSAQGDRAILDLLRSFGADAEETNTAVTVRPAPLHGIQIDASDIPDLVPVLAAVAAVAAGTTRITHASRLRIKESDRLKTVQALLQALGAKGNETADGLIIEGKNLLYGGKIDAADDHRIAMTAAVLSACCTQPVTICGAQAVDKSYPAFWTDFSALGGQIQICGEEKVQ